MPNTPDLIGSADVCNVLDINRATLSRWVRTGKLTPAMRLPGKHGAMLFDPADVEACRLGVAADEERERERRERRRELLDELAQLSNNSH